MSAVAVLREAKRLIATKGRNTYFWEAPNGSLCPLGAIAKAEHGNAERPNFADGSPSALFKTAAGCHTVSSWNMDATDDEVLRVFDRAIRAAADTRRASESSEAS